MKKPNSSFDDSYDENEENCDDAEMKITHAEEKFIERLARHPNFTMAEFIDIVREMDARQAKLKTNDRCRKWLDWINERCGIKLMIEEEKNILRKARSEFK